MDLILRACHKTSPGYRNLGCFKDGRDKKYGGRETRDVFNGSGYETWMKSGSNKLTTENAIIFVKIREQNILVHNMVTDVLVVIFMVVWFGVRQ